MQIFTMSAYTLNKINQMKTFDWLLVRGTNVLFFADQKARFENLMEQNQIAYDYLSNENTPMGFIITAEIKG